ncbi:MAG: tRNA uridine-5-carboxymethylaminomethyl(34) synthesis enzyme MnmG [Phycisphaerales bacterium]
MSAGRYEVVVVGGGHAGAEAAWAAANTLGRPHAVALVTLDPARIGVMACNPAIGGLAKGQLVREIDALGGLMGLAADATGIHFKVLNTSKGPAVHGPRCQSDKIAYARCVQSLLATRPEIDIVSGPVECLITQGAGRRIVGVEVGGVGVLHAPAVVVTTGTFMRGLMHRGEDQRSGGREGEAAVSGMSASLASLGFELGRLKTGTPPRLRKGSIDWEGLEIEPPDADPTPFSELTRIGWSAGNVPCDRFPLIEQAECRRTATTAAMHDLIRANLDRAPMFSGQITSAGPRYCPSIEDKVVRFPDRAEHGVFLEPESHESDWVYCNGISTSLPADVQLDLVRSMPGCERAEIAQYGYAVEYDSVMPHQIRATGMTKRVDGLFLAGQINGTSGYEEAAAQGLVAGLNAARHAQGLDGFAFGRDQAYIGVLMDDLVTKRPVEPYRMFTSRAEHRLLLRADNAPDRLTPVASELGLLGTTELGRARERAQADRARAKSEVHGAIDTARVGADALSLAVRRPEFGWADLRDALPEISAPDHVWRSVHADRRYDAYVARQLAEIRRSQANERRPLPAWLDYHTMTGLRAEAMNALHTFRPETFGQAGRLEGVTPADLTLLSVHVKRQRAARAGAS